MYTGVDSSVDFCPLGFRVSGFGFREQALVWPGGAHVLWRGGP